MDDSIRSGEKRVPPGQYVTDKWPVLTHGPTPSVGKDAWQVRLIGAVEKELTLGWAELQALPRAEVLADFHCVTRFSTLDNRWEGIATRTLLAQVRPVPEAAHVVVHCYGGYTTNLPLEDFLSERALLADRHNRRHLPPDHGGPLRLVVPHLYAWKSAKWVNGIELLPEERRGFWERNGSHPYGDPWTEQRFSFQETKNAGEVRRRARELGLVPGEKE